MAHPPRAARGSLTGKWQPTGDRRPNIRGHLTLEQDLPAGTVMHIAGWSKEIAGAEFVSLSATIATKAAPGRERRRRRTEPEGRFSDTAG